ncbi:MAG: LLM class F420-dependent oxidoreductase [Acidimicrobiia bacterium]|nr:LLM class F420-dependent oxidoreductase [Acidimicrobiia bacterium]
MRIAVQIHPQHAEWNEITDAVKRAEDMGVDIVYNWDHFYPLYGDGDGKHFECWTMLAAWAEMTERVEIGALVTCNSYRNPELVADMARTVDHISDGRLILGIGSGWFEKDYDQYGYEFGNAPGRLKHLDAAMPRIKSRLAKLNPAPTRDIPVLIGGGGEKVTLRITSEHADIWHGFGPAAQFAHKNKVLDEWCTKVGRDPASIERSVGVQHPRNDLKNADAFLEAGAGQITLGYGGPDFSMGSVPDWIKWRDGINA